MRSMLLGLLLLVACESKPVPRPPPSPNAVPVSFDSDPPGAGVTIDGQGVGMTPLQARIEPGPHRVMISMAGYLPYQTEIRIGSGSPTKYKAALIASH